MIIIDLLHLFDELIEANIAEVLVVALRHFVIRVIDIFLAHDGENHVISVEITRWFEEFVAVELHALTQRESIGQAIRRDGPVRCQ